MKRSADAVRLLIGPIVAFMMAAGVDKTKAGDPPTSVDDRVCPCPWIGAEPTSAAWFASSICGTVASDTTAPDVGSSRASRSAGQSGVPATVADLEEAGFPPDFLYVYSPCDYDDGTNTPSEQASVPATAEWSNEADHGYCYDLRLLDNGTWHDPYAWLHPGAPSANSATADRTKSLKKAEVLQGDLSWLVEECLCDSRHDLGLAINMENDGLSQQTPPAGQTRLAAQKRAADVSEPTGFRTIIDGPSRFLFVRRGGRDFAADSVDAVDPRPTRADDGPDAAHPSAESTRPLMTAASNMFRAASQIALDVARALDRLNEEVSADGERPDGAVPHTATSAGDRSASRVTPYLGL